VLGHLVARGRGVALLDGAQDPVVRSAGELVAVLLERSR